MEKVQDVCKDNGVEDFAIPRRIKIVSDSWTPDSGLVNDALKLKRKAIAEKYRSEIEQLYRDAATNGSNDSSSPMSGKKNRSE